MDRNVLLSVIIVVASILVAAVGITALTYHGPDPDKETITFTPGEGYSYSAKNSVKVDKGSDFFFTVVIDTYYAKTGDFSVCCDGNPLTEASGGYTITNIQNNCTVTVNGVADTRTEYTFYIADNFANDDFDRGTLFPMDPTTISKGIWIKSKALNASDAFSLAMGKMGRTTTITDGNLTAVGDVVTNLYVWQWDENAHTWNDKNAGSQFLKLGETTSTTIAVIHGASSVLGGGDAPLVNTTPSDAKWFWGEDVAHKEGQEVYFYIGDEFRYAEYSSSRSDASDVNTLLVPGIWVRGYAPSDSVLSKALDDAMERIGWTYATDDYKLYVNDVNDGNYFRTRWSNDGWNPDSGDANNWDIRVIKTSSVSYFTIIHGRWDGGSVTPPIPDVSVKDIIWAL